MIHICGSAFIVELAVATRGPLEAATVGVVWPLPSPTCGKEQLCETCAEHVCPISECFLLLMLPSREPLPATQNPVVHILWNGFQA